MRSTAGDTAACWCTNGVKCCGVDTDPAKCTSEDAASQEKREVTMRLYHEVGNDGSTTTRAVECDPGCYDLHAGLEEYPTKPVCWDNNATVDATLDCFNATGGVAPTCVTIGYTSTAYIPTCGGRFGEEGGTAAEGRGCGVYVELHRPGDERVLAEAKIPGGDWAFPSGYRLMRMPLTYFGDAARVVCEGAYELWWTSRTRYNFIVEYQKGFTIVNPPCDWDSAANDFGEFFGMARIAARKEAEKAAGIELTPEEIERQNNMARVTDEYGEEAGAAAGKGAAGAAAGGADAAASAGGGGSAGASSGPGSPGWSGDHL